MTFSPQQDMQPLIAEAASLARQRPQALAQIGIVWSAVAIPDGGSLRSDNATRPPLAHLVMLHKDRNGFAPSGGRYHFRDSKSFKAA
jgi:hypothetical protein